MVFASDRALKAFKAFEHVNEYLVSRYLDLLVQQELKGIVKYGATIDLYEGTDAELVRHALEEVVDLSLYLSEALERLPERGDMIRQMIQAIAPIIKHLLILEADCNDAA